MEQLFDDTKNKNEINSDNDYLNLFENITNANCINETFKHICDIRKFEIDLYWKRATYFWTFIAAILAGYFATFAGIKDENSKLILVQYLLNCLGLVFTFGWYVVNRGSKFWQENWEKHMDLMEDKVIGPLYKTTINMDYYGKPKNLIKLLKAFPFSVSKTNLILNIFLTIFWLVMLIEFNIEHLSWGFTIKKVFSVYTLIGLMTFIALFSMINFNQTGLFSLICGNRDYRKVTDVKFRTRTINNK
jgi:hypothetical protein